VLEEITLACRTAPGVNVALVEGAVLPRVRTPVEVGTDGDTVCTRGAAARIVGGDVTGAVAVLAWVTCKGLDIGVAAV
jgi:hypothetical protein